MVFERCAFETTLCVLECFVEFYVFILDEIGVKDPKLVYDHIRVKNVWVNVLKNQPRTLHLSQRLSRPASID